jgi:hypothetical protein
VSVELLYRRQLAELICCLMLFRNELAYHHTSAYVSIRQQRTSAAYVSIRALPK